jgi:hypothetical protein
MNADLKHLSAEAIAHLTEDPRVELSDDDDGTWWWLHMSHALACVQPIKDLVGCDDEDDDVDVDEDTRKSRKEAFQHLKDIQEAMVESLTLDPSDDAPEEEFATSWHERLSHAHWNLAHIKAYARAYSDDPRPWVQKVLASLAELDRLLVRMLVRQAACLQDLQGDAEPTGAPPAPKARRAKRSKKDEVAA